MIRSKFALSLKKQYSKTGARPPVKVDLQNLKDKNFWENFANQMDTKLDVLTFPDTTVEGEWETLKTAVFDTAKKQLGRPKRRNQDWFDDDDMTMMKSRII